MATYSELYDLTSNVPLIQKVMAAVAILADAIRVEAPATPNHALRLAWAKNAIANVDGVGRGLIWILLAQNSTLTVAQIEGASDAAIQNAVDSAVEILL